jgi:uncharacterized protein (DUF1697 family)
MARLREVVEGLGYDDVRTHLQSGNVVFATRAAPGAAAGAIEKAIAEHLGHEVKVLVRSRDELAKVVERNPLGEHASEPAKLHVTFLSARPDRRRLREVDPADFEPDVFRAGGREIYAWYPNGVQKTKLSHAFWEKRLGLVATSRNWNTVTRLLALADE